MSGKKAGFTLLEALIALFLVASVAAAGYVFIGRKLVDKGDPVRTALKNGYVEPKVEERHDFFAWRHGCTTHDDVAFTLSVVTPEALRLDGTTTKKGTIVVCCGAWFAGCHMAGK